MPGGRSTDSERDLILCTSAIIDLPSSRTCPGEGVSETYALHMLIYSREQLTSRNSVHLCACASASAKLFLLRWYWARNRWAWPCSSGMCTCQTGRHVMTRLRGRRTDSLSLPHPRRLSLSHKAGVEFARLLLLLQLLMQSAVEGSSINHCQLPIIAPSVSGVLLIISHSEHV